MPDVDECEHNSADGVDLAPFGPDKVWLCLECGRRFRSVPVDPAVPFVVRSVLVEGRRA